MAKKLHVVSAQEREKQAREIAELQHKLGPVLAQVTARAATQTIMERSARRFVARSTEREMERRRKEKEEKNVEQATE